MKQAALRGLIVGGTISAVYVASIIGWTIGRWCYFTFG